MAHFLGAAIVLVVAAVHLTAAAEETIANCTDNASNVVVSNSIYRLINCTAENVTFHAVGGADLLNVVVLVDGGTVFPTIHLPPQLGGARSTTGRMSNVTVAIYNVVAQAPAVSTPIRLESTQLAGVTVQLNRVHLAQSDGALVLFRSAGQFASLSVTDCHIHSSYVIDTTNSSQYGIFEFNAYDGEHLSVEIQRSEFFLRQVQTRASVVALLNFASHVQVHIADVTVSSRVVRFPSFDFFVSVANFAPHITSMNASIQMERVVLTVDVLEGVVINDQMDVFLVDMVGWVQHVRVVCEASTMYVHGGLTASFVLMKDIGNSLNVSVALRSCVAAFILDGGIGRRVASSSGRSGTMVRISGGDRLADAHVSARNVTLNVHLLKQSNGVLESYAFARSSIVFVASIATVIGLRVSVVNASTTVVVDDRIQGVVQLIFGTRVFQASASFVVIQQCDVRASSFLVDNVVLNANMTVGAPPAFPSTITSLINSWSGIVGGVIVANVTDCNATVTNAIINTQQMDVRRGDGDVGSCSLVMNLTAVVLTLDVVEQLRNCASAVVAAGLPASLLPSLMQHMNFNITIDNATIRFGDRATETDAAAGALYNPPSSTNNVRLEAVRAVVVRHQAPDGGVAARMQQQLSALLYVYSSTIHVLHVTLREVHGWQAVVYRAVMATANINDATITVFNSSLIASPSFPWVVSVPMASLANVRVQTDSSVLVGFASYLTSANSHAQPPLWDSARPSFAQLACNVWDGDPTTRRFYNKVVISNLHPPHPGLVVDTTAACYEAPTQTIPVVEPARNRILGVSDAAASASTIAIAVSGAASVVMPSVASGLSAVRLQTTMRVLRNRQRCTAAEAATSDGGGSEDGSGGDAYGSYAIDNPTLAALGGLGPERAYAGGAVLANTALITALAVATSALPRIWASWKTKGGPFVTEGRRAWLLGLLERVPGSGVAVYAILLQPLTGCSLLLIALNGPDRVGAVVLGIAGLSFAVGTLVLVCVRVLYGGFPLVARPVLPTRRRASASREQPSRSRASAESSSQPSCASSPLAGAIAAIADPRWEWRAPSHASEAGSGVDRARRRLRCRVLLERYGPVFDAFRKGLHWYFTVDLCTTAVLGLIDALPAASVGLCDATLYGVLAITLLSLASVCLARPCAAPLDNILAIAGAALTAATTVLLVVSEGGEATDAAVEVLVLLQSTLAIVGELCTFAAVVVRIARGGLSWWMSAAPPPIQNLFSADALPTISTGRRQHSTRDPRTRNRSPPQPIQPTHVAGSSINAPRTQAQKDALSALLEMACSRASQLQFAPHNEHLATTTTTSTAAALRNL